MKKWIALLLVLTMVLSLAACGDKEEKKPASLKEAAKETVVREDKPAEKPVEKEKPEKKPVEEENPGEMSIDEIVVVDNDECTIRLTDVYVDEYSGLVVKCFCENKSADTTYMFAVEDGTVNGLDTDPFFATELSPGKKANEEICFWIDDLEKLGITEFTDIWMAFRVYDSNDYMADPVAQTEAHVYPYGEENAERYLRMPEAGDVVLMENDEALVVAVGTEMDELWGYTVVLYLENRTDSSIMFSTDEVSVDGYMIDPFFARSVPANSCSYETMTWGEDDFAENGIDPEEIEEIEMVLDIYDDDDWDKPDYFEERVVYNP